jgi:hypothetical protein
MHIAQLQAKLDQLDAEVFELIEAQFAQCSALAYAFGQCEEAPAGTAIGCW